MDKRKIIITHNIDRYYYEQIQGIAPDWELISGKDVTQDQLDNIEKQIEAQTERD